jgi:hypothetical protein
VALIALLGPLLALGLVVRGGTHGHASGDAARSARASGHTGAHPSSPAPPQLPRGGREILPRYRVVAYYGAAGTSRLGVLGDGTPRSVLERLHGQAQGYRKAHGGGRRPVMPALELIATVAIGSPGADGKYRIRHLDTVRRYLRAARRAHGLLILDIQPGRADFLDEVKPYARFLAQPDVSLALDPEWSMGPGEVPGAVRGSTDAATINRVSGWLADLVRRHHLPQKLLIVHQFTRDMIEQRSRVVTRPGLALVDNVDGFGAPALKRDVYHRITRGTKRLYHGFKLFYDQDDPLMSPREVLRLRPRPNVIEYE